MTLNMKQIDRPADRFTFNNKKKKNEENVSASDDGVEAERTPNSRNAHNYEQSPLSSKVSTLS